MRDTNTYRRQLRQRLVELGPARQCGGHKRCPYNAMGVIEDNFTAMLCDPTLTSLIDERPWRCWSSSELLDLIDKLEGPVDFLVEA